MVGINWGLGPGNALSMFSQGAQIGQQLRARQDENELRGAFGRVLSAPKTTPGIGDKPVDTSADMGIIAQHDPRLFMQLQQRDQQQAQQAQAAKVDQIKTIARLLDEARDEGSYQRGLAAARQLGMDVSSVPQSYDPAWVAQQRTLLSAFVDDDGTKLSGIARELVDAGYQPGTPQFNEAMRSVISNKYASDYVDDAGNVRRRSALNLDAPAKPQIIQQRPAGLTDADLMQQAQEAVRNGAKWEDVFEQLRAWGVKP